MKVTIKLDKNKIRVYFEDSNPETLQTIQQYLQEQGYKNASNFCNSQSVLLEQTVASYSLANYSIAYNETNDGDNEILFVETWLPIAKHFTDSTLATAIGQLVMHLSDSENEIMVIMPNKKVSDLRSRQYHAVFTQDGISLKGALQLIKKFESAIREVRKDVGLPYDYIPSDVKISFDKPSDAIHSKGLAVFGLMAQFSQNSNSSSSSSSSSSSKGSLKTQPPSYSM